MLFLSLVARVAVATGLIAAANALPELEIVGNKFFFKENGSQFLIRGVAYQQNTANATGDVSFVDPLADPEACKRDIPYLRNLNTNAIRVYAVNTSMDHSECMQMLEDAGIYVISDLSQPDESINRKNPTWDVNLFSRYTDVIDSFANYTNILGFFAGNEVTNDAFNTDASAYVKAAVRDSKAYIKAKGLNIPVGYSANDDTDIRIPLAEYFACGDADERADFFGINMYEWCGDSSFKASGYQTITNEYQNLGIPLFFSEYGCNEVQPREFQEVGTIYSSQMTGVWSGAIVYMYFQEENNYGLVSVDGNSVSTLVDYNNLKSQLASVRPTLATAGSNSSATVASCPSPTSNWDAATNLPPTPDKDVCGCITPGAGCVVDSSVDSDDYLDLFGFICGEIDCSGVNGNGTTGDYGAFSACEAKDKLNFVLNLYYLSQDSAKDACDFSGSASLQSPKTASSCSAVFRSAGSSGLGTVAGSVPTGSSGSSGSGSSGSRSGSSSGSSKSGSRTGSSSSSTSTNNSAVKVGVSNDLSKYLVLGAAVVFGAGLIAV